MDDALIKQLIKKEGVESEVRNTMGHIRERGHRRGCAPCKDAAVPSSLGSAFSCHAPRNPQDGYDLTFRASSLLCRAL